jgi:hypothetical protein
MLMSVLWHAPHKKGKPCHPNDSRRPLVCCYVVVRKEQILKYIIHAMNEGVCFEKCGGALK